MKRQYGSSEDDGQDREILAPAAVFNGDFSIDWLQVITGAKASVILSALNRGIRNNQLKSERDGIYRFSDREIRDRFWKMSSPERRTILHRQAADIISEELPFGEESDRELVKHLLYIDNDEAGCRQLLDAGNRARKEFRIEEAKRIYRKIFLDLSARGGKLADRLFTDAAMEYSKISTPASDSRQVIQTIREAVKRAQKRGLTENLALLRMHLAKQEWLLSNYKEAFYQFQLGWQLAETIDNPGFKRAADIFSVFFRFWQGRFKDVVADYEKFAPEISELPKTEFSLLAYLTIGACIGNSGQIHQGIGMMDVIRRHCKDNGNLNIASHAVAVLALFLVDLKRYEEAISYYHEAMENALKGHNLFIRVLVHLGLAHAFFRIGEQNKALTELKNYLSLSRRCQILAVPFPLLLEICFEMDVDQDLSIDGLTLDSEIRGSLRSENVYMKGKAVFYQALQKKRKGRPASEILITLQKAGKYLEASGHRIGLDNCLLETARILIQTGQQEQAVDLAAPAVRRLFALERSLVPDDFRFLVQHQDAEKELLKEILSLGQELAVIRDPRDLVNRIITTVNRILGAERGAIFLVEKNGGGITLKAAKNLTNSDITEPEFIESMQLIKETVSTGREHIKQTGPAGNGSSKGEGVHSIVCIPMILRNRIMGVLYADIRINRTIAQSPDVETLQYFAAQAAVMLDNAQTYQGLQQRYQKEREEKRYLEEQFLEEFHFEEIIGRSSAIKSVFTDIDSVATTDSAVLIFGETGVGKELVARAIHKTSRRRNGPFIKVNSSALSEFLAASELFGHEKGSFTGAVEQKIGRFELANGGTLFLDEIGDISQAVQLQLLRVLQTKEFERVGGRRTIHSDFRLMAATNKDLQQEIKKGRFRMDLYYRLNVFPINVPPLKERKEDIPLLAEHFLNIYTKKLGRQIDAIPDRVIETMIDYDWPGNVRELENFIERGSILSRNHRFTAPPINWESPMSSKESQVISHQANERKHILKALETTRGKISGKNGAAELLDLHPNTLRYRMKKLQIHIDRRPKGRKS